MFWQGLYQAQAKFKSSFKPKVYSKNTYFFKMFFFSRKSCRRNPPLGLLGWKASVPTRKMHTGGVRHGGGTRFVQHARGHPHARHDARTTADPDPAARPGRDGHCRRLRPRQRGSHRLGHVVLRGAQAVLRVAGGVLLRLLPLRRRRALAAETVRSPQLHAVEWTVSRTAQP